MGDLLPPKVREEVSRLRRRLVELRQHHGIRQERYNQTIPHGYEQQNQETLRLHQKLLESRAKKAAKVNKTNKDTSSQPDQRNNPITQQKKRKHDNTTSGDGGGAANVADAYTFDEPDEPANKALRTNGTGNNTENGSRGDGSCGNNNQLHQSVSVNIVQQIDTHADPQTNRIKLTVSSTLQTSGLAAGSKVGQSVTSTSVETSTNICKQEPVDNEQCPGSSNSSQNSFHDQIGLEDVDEISAILDTLEREEGAIPPELIKELDLGFKEGFEDSDSLSSSSHQDSSSKGADLAAQQQQQPPASSLSHRSPMFNNSGNHSTKSSPGPGMFADPVYDSSTHAAPVNPSLSTMGGQGAAAMANYHRPPTGGGAAPPPPILPVGDTGPAAETLKQMAAQHQTQNQNQDAAGGGGYPMKGQMPYGAPDYVDYTRRYTPHGYPPYPGQNYPMSATAQANMYPYNQQVPMNNHRAGHMAVQSMQGKDPTMNYGGTKPLSHYPGRMGGGGPSSLQQLQNQVQSHFGQGPSQNGAGPGPHLQISQSQHMQMTHGAGARMQMTQSQQMQIHSASPQISMAQQQTFSTMGGPQGPPGAAAQYHMNNQMKMQMMNQQHQAQQAQGAPTGGGPQAPPGSGPPQHPNMQSYMNRPPPEYKVPPGGVNNNYGQNANPLQTMQNMVNQTSQSGPSQNGGMYPHPQPGGGPPPPQQIKTEGMPPTAATGAGANRASPLTGPPNSSSMGPGPTNSPSGMRNYGQPGQPGGPSPGQMMPGQMPNGTATGASMKPPTPTNTQYTSAIMRNQRPPNVNVGPDGLNISQQRSHSGEWPRTMNPGGAGGPQQMVARPGMPPGANMMPYGPGGAYQGQGVRPMGGGGHMDAANMRMHISQQQAVMTSGQPGPMASHMHPGTGPAQTMMLQQQQALQVSHSGMAASMSQTMSARVSSPQSHPQQQQQPPPQQQSQQQQPQQQPQATQQQQQQRQQPSPQQQQQSQQQQPPQSQPPQQQQQQQSHPTSQSPHGPHPGYPHQSSTQNANSEFPLDFLDNAQGNGFFDSMVPHSGDFFDELFGK